MASAQVACKFHPDAILIEDSHAGDMICPECGLVVGDRVIDVGSEWRTFANNESADRSRVGDAENPLLDGGNLTTNIAYMPGSTAGLDEDGKQMYKNRKTMSSADRNLINAFREITQMCDRLNLPKSIGDRASALYKQVQDTKQLKGRSGEAVAAACLYIACRQEGVPRTIKEIVGVCRISKKDLGRVFKQIMKILETSVELITTGDFMSRFCSNLALPPSVQRCATHIARRTVDLYVCHGRTPISIAAASIYLASQASADKRSAKEIGEIAGVAVTTIQQTFRMMHPESGKLFPDDFAFVTPIMSIPSPQS